MRCLDLFAGVGARKGFEDKTKGTLFFDMLRIMKHHKPRPESRNWLSEVKFQINHT